MGMAEYIKRVDTFSDEMCEGIDCGVCPFYNKAGENDCQVVAFLRSIPAADVRPVVYCKDCRHRDPEDGKCDAGAVERAGCVFPVGDNYFCAYGER